MTLSFRTFYLDQSELKQIFWFSENVSSLQHLFNSADENTTLTCNHSTGTGVDMVTQVPAVTSQESVTTSQSGLTLLSIFSVPDQCLDYCYHFRTICFLTEANIGMVWSGLCPARPRSELETFALEAERSNRHHCLD